MAWITRTVFIGMVCKNLSNVYIESSYIFKVYFFKRAMKW